jgi:hypothetical protein
VRLSKGHLWLFRQVIRQAHLTNHPAIYSANHFDNSRKPMTITIDTAALLTSGAEQYFTKNDHRMAAFRGALEMLGIPLPLWAERRPSGRKPSVSVALAYRADNPETLHEATMRKSREAASRLPTKSESGGSLPDRIAALKAPAPDTDPLNGLFS